MCVSNGWTVLNHTKYLRKKETPLKPLVISSGCSTVTLTTSSPCAAQDDWEKPKSVFSRHSLQYQTSLRINLQGRDLILLNSSASCLGFYCGCPQAISNFCLCMWPAENHSAPSWGHAPWSRPFSREAGGNKLLYPQTKQAVSQEQRDLKKQNTTTYKSPRPNWLGSACLK